MTDSLRPDSLITTLGGRIIYLVGMMGSGKSMTGPHLAKLLNYSFVDQDKLIEEVAKTSIQNIFQQEGESAFRDIETQVLKEIGNRHSLIVATGGGVVTRSVNWGTLHQGIVVWINPSIDCLLKRLKLDQNQRPLLKNNHLLPSLEILMKERHPFYVESDVEIVVQEETPEQVAKEICRKLETILSN